MGRGYADGFDAGDFGELPDAEEIREEEARDAREEARRDAVELVQRAGAGPPPDGWTRWTAEAVYAEEGSEELDFDVPPGATAHDVVRAAAAQLAEEYEPGWTRVYVAERWGLYL